MGSVFSNTGKKSSHRLPATDLATQPAVLPSTGLAELPATASKQPSATGLAVLPATATKPPSARPINRRRIKSQIWYGCLVAVAGSNVAGSTASSVADGGLVAVEGSAAGCVG